MPVRSESVLLVKVSFSFRGLRPEFKLGKNL